MSHSKPKRRSSDPKNRTERRKIGDAGEDAAAFYLKKHGFTILGRNIARKTGELDVVARKDGTLHAIEVKTLMCEAFPSSRSTRDRYDPAENLHPPKIRRVARTAEWYVAETGWEGEWQIDAILVWRRAYDGRCLVRYLPQIQ